MVTVMRGGEEVKISKRAGSYVTVRDLIDEVGRDAVRYFFLMRKGDSQLVFDVDVARSQSEENPVYYIQMAHARMSGIFRVGEIDPASITGVDVDLSVLTLPEEQELMKALLDYPALVAGAAEALEPHRVATYLHDTAGKVHLWYHKAHVLNEPEPIMRARLVARARGADRVAQWTGVARDHGAGANVKCCWLLVTANGKTGELGSDSISRKCGQTPIIVLTQPATKNPPPATFMSVLVVGSVALDSVETPFGKADNVLGGSGNFFSASASHLSPVQLVGVIGSDYPIDKLERALMRDLRARCDWDRVKTHQSLRPYLIEESHELDDALRTGDVPAMREELGDVLLQVLFHSVLAEEAGAFDAHDVAAALIEKMKRRHPHLYGGGPKERWETMKARSRTSLTEGFRRDCRPCTAPNACKTAPPASASTGPMSRAQHSRWKRNCPRCASSSRVRRAPTRGMHSRTSSAICYSLS